MNYACSEKPSSARRVLQEKTETRKPKTEKEATDAGTFTVVTQIRGSLSRIEVKLDKKIYNLEEWLSSEDELFTESMSQLEANKPVEKKVTSDMGALFQDLVRIEDKIDRHTESEIMVRKIITNNAEETQKLKNVLQEIRMERDVLLERVHSYLEQISSLKSKIEEQRCKAGTYERQVSAVYENQVRKLEADNEELKNTSAHKDKQLREVNEQLKQMNLMLKSHELQSWEKKNEECAYISLLKSDLETTRNEKIRMEEEFKRLKRMCGYTEREIYPEREESLRTILRRSKSMSNLTLQISSSSVGDTDKEEGDSGKETGGNEELKRGISYQPSIKDKRSSIVSADSSSRRKIKQELTSIERKLAEQTVEVKKLSSRREKMESDMSVELEIGIGNLALKIENLREQLRQGED